MTRDFISFTVANNAIAACPPATAAGNPTALYPVDLDGDGIDEVAVYSQDMNSQPAVAPTLQVFDAHCPITKLGTDRISDCIAITRVGGQLVGLCSSGVSMGKRGLFQIIRAGTELVRGEERVTLDAEGQYLTAGDFDGDGVTDVAVGVNRGGVIHVELVRQCPAHDTRRCPNRPAPAGEI